VINGLVAESGQEDWQTAFLFEQKAPKAGFVSVKESHERIVMVRMRLAEIAIKQVQILGPHGGDAP